MKILHVVPGLTRGGAETFLARLIPELARQGIVSEVACIGPRGPIAARLQEAGTPVHLLDFEKNASLLFRFPRLVSLLRRVRPDAVQGWMYPANLAALAAAACLGKRTPVYWNIRQSLYAIDHEKAAMAWMIRAGKHLSGLPARIVYNSREGARQHEEFGYSEAKTQVIPNGFDLEAFHPATPGSRRSAREKLGLPTEAILMGSVGRDHPKKDRASFLEAAAHVAAALPDAHFVLAGRDLDAARQPLRDHAQALGLGDRITFLGEQDNPEACFAALDVFVSSSYAEGFPNVVGEAMACGIPCVATDVGDTAYLLGEGGVIVPPREPRALAEALLGLAHEAPGARAARGAAGRLRIARRFSLETVGRRYRDLYLESDASGL